MIKVGLGVDVHQFADGRPCILGGVEIPHTKGLKGHSDADALVHAVMDALLGAVGEKDIGHFFPDKDPKWKDASSLKMLGLVQLVLERKKGVIQNIDTALIAQEPKLSPHIEKMAENISQVLKISPNQIGIKATTSEWMGFTGRKEGVVALAVACIECS
jgi:2-C-methyl-D-erythritol 2,4-cyclodiphosphate synthase